MFRFITAAATKLHRPSLTAAAIAVGGRVLPALGVVIAWCSLPALGLVIVWCSLPTFAIAGTLSITRWTIDSGGAGFSHVAPYTMAGTVGQPDAGRLTGSPYLVTGGFWGAGPLSITSVAIPTPDPTEPASGPAHPVARILPTAPNPTGGAARFAFELPEARRVQIRIFGVGGALVRTLTDQVWMTGRHVIAWDGRDTGGAFAAAGLYFVRVRLGSMERTQKLLIVR